MKALVPEDYMRRCIGLAALGAGKVSPNPMVGALVVRDGKIISEGYHKIAGGPHAEVEALQNLPEELSTGADIYISLEPCCHHGKTPPCTDLLIRTKPRRVYFAAYDPNPLVSGQGEQKLKAAGIEVHQGLCYDEAAFINRRFFTWIRNKRPYVILKWALSADGFMGLKGERTQLTSALSLRLSHRWRTEEDAILAGAGTVLTDNPKLTSRLWPGKNPLRVVLVSQNNLPQDLNIFNSEAETCVIETGEISDDNAKEKVSEILEHLFSKNIQSVIIEGGSKTLNAFIKSGLWDEARVFRSQHWLYNGVPGPAFKARLHSETFSGDDKISFFLNSPSS